MKKFFKVFGLLLIGLAVSAQLIPSPTARSSTTQVIYNASGIPTGSSTFTFTVASGTLLATIFDSGSVAGSNGVLLKAQGAAQTCSSIGANNVKLGMDSGLVDTVHACLDDDTQRIMRYRGRIVTEAGTPITHTVVEAYDTVLRLTGAGAQQINLVAAVAGMHFCVADDAAGGVVSINPNGSEIITIPGTVTTGGDEIDSPNAVGDFVCLKSLVTGTWMISRQTSVWVDGGTS